MSKRIKGVTIVIDGETKALDKALSDVNKRSKDLQGELRQVDRLLKFNPGNTELLAQKQKLLGDQVETTRERLNRLKAAQDEVTKSFQRGEISEEQYRAFQREIVQTESKLEHFSKQLRDVEKELNTYGKSMQEAGQKMKDFGDRATAAGKDMSMKVTAPILGIGTAAVMAGANFEEGMSRVAALSGATGDELQSLENQARELGATTKFSATEAASGMEFLAMAGFETADIMETMPGLLSLAAAGAVDLGTAADITSNILSGFGFEASEASRVSDILALAASSSNTSINALGEAMKYVSPVASGLGVSIEDTSAAIGILGDNGIAASQAGTTLRAGLLRLASPAGAAAKTMEELNIEMFDANGQMKDLPSVIKELEQGLEGMTDQQRTAALTTIFGAEAVSGWSALINTGSESVAEFSNELRNSEGAAKSMADVMSDNLKGRIDEMKSAFTEAGISVYQNLQPALESLVETVKSVADWFNNLSPRMQNTMVVIAGVAAAIGPLLIILGTLASSIGSIITVAGTLVTSLGGAGKAVAGLRTAITLMTGPIGLAIAAVASLIAIGIALYRNWDTISEKAREAWGKVTQRFDDTVDGIKSGFDTIKNIDLVQVGKDIIQGLVNGISSMAETAWESVKSVGEGIISTVTGLFKTASPSRLMYELGQFVTQGLALGIESEANKASEAARKVAEEVVKSFNLSMGWIGDQKYFGRISLDEELFVLEQLYDKYKDHAEQRMQLEREMFRVRNEIERAGFEHSKNWIDERKYYNELSLEEELKAWQRMQVRYKEGSEERKQIDREVYRVQQELSKKRQEDLKAVEDSYNQLGNIIKQLSDIEKKYHADMAASLDEYRRKVRDTQRELQSNMERVRREYAASIDDINSKMIDSERKVTEDYNNELQRRISSLSNFTNLFSRVTAKQVTGDELLNNLKSQVDAFEDWQENIASLSARGIDDALLEQLRSMGPEAGSEIAALNSLSDEKLTEYVNLWRSKQQSAKEEAVAQLTQQRKEMNTKLEEIRRDAQSQMNQQMAEMSRKLQEMRSKASAELEQYKLEWQKKNEEIKKNADEQIQIINDKYNDLTERSTRYGIDMVSNFIEGAQSQFGRLEQTMLAMTQMVDSYMPHSPAKVGPLKRLGEWGPGLVDTFVDGIQKSLPSLETLMNRMATLTANPLATTGVARTENNYGGNIINIHVQGGTPRDQVDGIIRELHKRGIKV